VIGLPSRVFQRSPDERIAIEEGTPDALEFAQAVRLVREAGIRREGSTLNRDR
jgi:hypothetical protein